MNTDGPGELILVSIPRTLPFGDVFSLAEEVPSIAVSVLVNLNLLKSNTSLEDNGFITARKANLVVLTSGDIDLPHYFLMVY